MHALHVHLATLLTASAILVPVAARCENPAPCALPAYASDKVALVVGTDDYSIYQSDKIPTLRNAANDARSMAALLAAQGFTVRCLINPTQLTFRDEKTRLAIYLQARQLADPQAADEGRAVVYIAGHGYRDPETNEDYVLFRYEADEAKYSHIVNFQMLAGRLTEGRWSVQSLTQAFNTSIQGVMFIFDACRSVIEIPASTGGTVRAGPIQQLPRDLMKGSQIVAYSTQPGGTAADEVPNSSEQNGLYASALSNFMSLSIFSLGHALDLTGAVVSVNKPDQLPIYSISARTFFASNPWVNNEPASVCDMVNSEIWNAAGKRCSQLKEATCIVKDICPVVTPHLRGAATAQAVTCLAQHKDRWLHNDLITVCSPPAQLAAPTPNVEEGFSINNIRSEAYNVATASKTGLPVNVTTLSLLSWAARTTRLQGTAQTLSDEELSSRPDSLTQSLRRINAPAKKLVYSNRQRDNLIAKSSDGKVPALTSPAPFRIDLTDRTITLRSLPASSASVIDTFSSDNAAAEIDCYTIPCIKGWIGVRIRRGDNVIRGWVSSEELKSVVIPGTTIEIEYDGRRIAPTRNSIEALRRAARPDRSKPPVVGRIHIMAIRSTLQDETSSFLASARISFLVRAVVDLGIRPDDVDATVVDLPPGSRVPPAVVNLGTSF
jgi:hypothetical protein